MLNLSKIQPNSAAKNKIIELKIKFALVLHYKNSTNNQNYLCGC